MYDKAPYFYGTGRRKSSVARVRIYQGTGKVTINDRDIDDYFGLDTLKTDRSSAAGAHRVPTRSSTSSAALQAAALPVRPVLSATASPEPCSSTIPRTSAPTLKKAGFLTRDPRMKERKKYGLKAARRAPQFSKR